MEFLIEYLDNIPKSTELSVDKNLYCFVCYVFL